MNTSFVPLYRKLFDNYKGKIVAQEIKPGHQIDSISRIMQKHKVSRETAKLVLKMLIDEKLIISKAGKGSYVTPLAHTKKIWGMVLPFYSSNMEQLIHYLRDEAQKNGRQLTWFFGYNNPEEEMRLVGTMILEGYEAVIVVPNNDESLTAEFYRRLFVGNTMVVLVDNTMSGSWFRYVIQSYDLGVKRAIDYLAQVTRHNLLLVKNETWKGRNLLYEFMEQTFTNIVSANYPNRKVFVISNLNEFSTEYIQKNSIEGVLCCSDTDAIRVIGRLQKQNLSIPGDLSIVSYGNTELTEFFNPAITVIDCGYKQMAEQTALLIKKGSKAGPYEQHIILPKLIIRNT
jgi:DNA-binding LacI/PurR family transcriptional regulator